MKQLIRTIRSKANMNQEQFAKALGTTALSINRWENGKTVPNKMAQAQLYDFCKIRKIDIFDYLISQFKVDSYDDKLIVYHGSKKGLVGDIAPTSREFCDFGKGFYLGTDASQPLTLICDEKKPPGQYRLLLIVPYEVVSLFSPPAAKNAANIRG